MRTGDVRLGTIIATVLAIVALGLVVRSLPLSATVEATPSPASAPIPSAGQTLLEARFQQAAAMLHTRRYAYAVTALHEVLQLAPRLPEAHANMGFALLGLDRPAAAVDFFNSALALRPTQINAYYGLAEALHQAGDVSAALGAMRSYVHLARADDPFLPKAQRMLGKWESRLDGDQNNLPAQAIRHSERDAAPH